MKEAVKKDNDMCVCVTLCTVTIHNNGMGTVWVINSNDAPKQHSKKNT